MDWANDNSLTSSGICCENSNKKQDNKNSYFELFISAAIEYNKTRSETISSELNRYLQSISASVDLSVFDPNNSVICIFFVNLHKLMSELESSSSLIWSGINVLQQACKNRSCQRTLINTYHFLPILSKILGDHLTSERKIRLLTLIQELSYGIKITWQEPYLPHLITLVVKWIAKIDSEIHLWNLSLGVLTNLCYKNLPAIYTLLRCVDTKKLLIKVMSMQNANCVHVCKLLIILENINGKLTNIDITKFVTITIDSVCDALQKRDIILLRHIVDFFNDFFLNSKENQIVFKQYDKFSEKILKLLNSVEKLNNNNGSSYNLTQYDPECMGMLFEFLLTICKLDTVDKFRTSFQVNLVRLSLNWIQNDQAGTEALALLHFLSTQSETVPDDLLESLKDGLKILLILLNSITENENLTCDKQKRLTSLMDLLKEMVKCSNLRHEILDNLNDTTMNKMFYQLISNSALSPRARLLNHDTFSTEATTFYLHTLSLIKEISKYEVNWLNYFNDLIRLNEIHMVIANGFYKGDSNVKRIVFELSQSNEFPSGQVAQVFEEIQLISPNQLSLTNKTNQINDPMPYTIMSFEQEEKLDNLLMKLNEAFKQNKLVNTSTCNVMELFDYKLAAMGHAERASQASLESASQQIINLQHSLTQLTVESSRLHQMLYHAQNLKESCDKELTKSNDNLKQTLTKLAKAKTELNELNNQLKSTQNKFSQKTDELSQAIEKIETLEKNYQDLNDVKMKMEEELQRNEMKITELNKINKKMEEKMLEMEKKINEKNDMLSKSKIKIETLNQEILKHVMQIEKQEKEYQHLQAKVNIYKQELNEYKDKIEFIKKNF